MDPNRPERCLRHKPLVVLGPEHYTKVYMSFLE